MILIVEDELRVRAFIARGLSEEGYQVREVGDGAAALAAILGDELELVLLDWMLPKMAGIDVLKNLRARGVVTPVVMLTAKDEVESRVAALDAGADDYLVKPFAFEELLARVRAVLRRTQGRAEASLRCADLIVDPAKRTVKRAGQDIRLTAREFDLLRFLLEHQGEVLSRARIVEAVWDHDFETFSNVVEVYVRYLRAKVDEPFATRLIQTVRGAGYVLREERP